MFGRKLNSHEAKDVGLVSQVFRREEFKKAVAERTLAMAQLPAGSMLATKRLMRERERAVLSAVNKEECEV
jgi:enoyl-CoA hydratase/carnithine racemase